MSLPADLEEFGIREVADPERIARADAAMREFHAGQSVLLCDASSYWKDVLRRRSIVSNSTAVGIGSAIAATVAARLLGSGAIGSLIIGAVGGVISAFASTKASRQSRQSVDDTVEESSRTDRET